MASANASAAVTLTHLSLQCRYTVVWATATSLWQPLISAIQFQLLPSSFRGVLLASCAWGKYAPLLNWVYWNPFLLFCLVWRSQNKDDKFYLSAGMSEITILSFKPAPFRPQLRQYVVCSGSADVVLFSGHPSMYQCNCWRSYAVILMREVICI